MQTDKQVWFITGAGRGMGVDIAQAALTAGRAVVATGRNADAVGDAIGEADDLLVVALDVTSLASAKLAVQAAVDRFGRIDVLVNNAGNFHAGFFEELTPEQIEQQRMESLRYEVEPFGIRTIIVEPGFFRTTLLENESTTYAELSIDDYAERTAQTRPAWEAMSGKQAESKRVARAGRCVPRPLVVACDRRALSHMGRCFPPYRGHSPRIHGHEPPPPRQVLGRRGLVAGSA